MGEELSNVDVLVGKTLTEVTRGGRGGEECLYFVTDDGQTYAMYHSPDCCETVYIEDICGDLNALVGSPILFAREDSSSDLQPGNEGDDSYTWTFYNFATTKGYVAVRWYGTSNGYYSESVDFYKL